MSNGIKMKLATKCGFCRKQVIGDDHGNLARRFVGHLRICFRFRRVVSANKADINAAIGVVLHKVGLPAPKELIAAIARPHLRNASPEEPAP